ncbi:MAG: GTP--adenosylcobinamide-phosphate guanylyltransferase [Euryarchaeota archaeon]|nr:GTP--adenosylcobinamide-phosphate guanylyltransferase [Euryarchaeota archaeon]
MVTALVMAGGEGTRLKFKGEKPLIKILGKPMIRYVIDALFGASKIKDIIVATSIHTPKTDVFIKKIGLKTIETPGDGYVSDLRFILSEFELGDVLLTITADLPLIRSDILDQVIKEYEKCGKPALSVAVPLEIFKKYGLKPSMVFDGMVPSGLNILRSINKQQDEEVLIIEKIELALNINNCKDITFLEKILGDTNG